MRFGSICSGIEAASVAWHPLGWRAAWLAEIEPFPCSLLAHHYPSVTNYGDMTALPDRIRAKEIEAPDVLCGGTPCQAFSVAGLRRSLDDARGNLSLTFCEIANAIDIIRRDRGKPECIIVWENVPGVLSTADNAFGCFLAGLAGESQPLQPAGKKWSNAGCVFGPKRTVAWRILDAQYFGVAQRRRRVFVVASARNGFDPASVLFEFDGVRRDTAPSREAREEIAGTLASRTGAGGFPGTDEACSGYVQPVHTGCWRDGGQVRQTLDAVLSKGQCMPEKNRFPEVLQPVAFQSSQSGIRLTETHATLDANNGPRRHNGVLEPVCVTGNITHTLKAAGFDGSEDGTGRGQPIVAQTYRDHMGLEHWLDTAVSVHGTQDHDIQNDQAHTLGCNSGQENAVLAFAENSRAELRLEGGDGSRTGALTSGGGKAGQGVPCVAVALRGRDGGATAELGDEIQNCLRASSGGGDKPYALTAMRVRRLTPRECERLQGFPDDYTLVPHRGKPAADGPRYKALGNSWAVPVVAWIGRRIAAYLRQNP